MQRIQSLPPPRGAAFPNDIQRPLAAKIAFAGVGYASPFTHSVFPMAENMYTEGDLAKKTNAELNEILQNLGRKKNGKKASLIHRILCATNAKK